MARYRRNFIAGGTFFFTVKLADSKSRHFGIEIFIGATALLLFSE